VTEKELAIFPAENVKVAAEIDEIFKELLHGLPRVIDDFSVLGR